MKRAKKLTVIVLTVIALLMTSCIYVIATSGDGTEGYYTYSKFNSKVTITDVDESISGAVEVPETIDGCEVIAIGEFAFENCSRVTSVSVPDCIKTIGRGAFKGMTSLEKVSVPYTGKSLNKTGYEGYFGYVFDYTTTETDGTVNQNGYYSYIPSSIKEVTVTQNSIIPGYAFQNCASVEKITAAKVTSCGSYSFRGCSSLTDFSSAAELKTIGDYAFGDCIGMTSIVIPASTTTIGAHAFDGCKNVKSIDFNDAETSIGDYAFANIPEITVLTVSKNATSIGRGAFYKDNKLTTVSIPYTGKSVDASGYEGVFGYIFDFTTSSSAFGITYQNINNYYYFIPTDIKTVTVTNDNRLADNAFYNCANITAVNLSRCTSLGNTAFGNCEKLSTVTLPDKLTSIGNSAFSNCTGLTAIQLPSSLKTIGNSAFYQCKNIKECNLPASLTTIGEYAFEGCSGVTELTVPDSVTSIGYGAFIGMPLTKLTVPFIGKGMTSTDQDGILGYWFGSGSIKQLYNSSTYVSCAIPTTLKEVTVTRATRIPYGAFSNCSFIEKIDIPDTVTSIEDRAFYNCSGLSEINIPNGIKEIKPYTFCGCSNLKGINLPDSVTTIGNYAFAGCKSITSAALPNRVTSIGSYAFSNCTGLTAIQLPSSLKTIGNSAFYQCKNIKECNLPASLTTIGEYAFEGCSGVTELTVPDSVTSIGYGAFIGMPLTKLTVPFIGKGMTSTDQDGILGYWFGSGSIKQLYNSSTYVSCAIPTTLKEVTVTRATRIPYGAFSNCSFIEKIDIPDTVTSIEDRAFYNCSGLTSLTTTEKITSIGNSAMAGCPNLTVFGVKDSYTNTYCTERNIPFVAYGEIASIAVKQAPTARQYVGNALNTTGLVLTATTADGTSYDVTSGYTVSGDKFDAAGEKTVTVSYNGKEASFKVNVIGVSAIMITSAPAKTTYFVGDTLNCSGLTFRVSYSDGTTAVKMSDYTTNVSTFTKSGEQIVRVYYYGANGVFKVYVNAVNIKNVEIETEPTKKTYFAGDAIDLAGLTLKVTYDNGTTATVDKGFTTSTTLDSSAVTTVVVDYQGFKVSYEVQVTDVVRVSWAMTSEPTKLEYQVGDSLDTTGLVITEYYNNGTSKEFTTGFTCTPDNFTEIGEQIVTVTYAGSTTMFVVNVTEKVHEHNYTSTVTKNATCTEAGIRTFTCECGDTYQESIDALGHDFGEWTVTKPATCTEKGIETRHCSRCDATETRETDKTEHVYTAVVTPPTCTEKGYTTHTCSCGDSYVDSYVDALGHDFGEWTVTKPATCTEKGIETRHCSRCDATETRETDKTEHVYTAVVTPPTCTEKGYTTHTCSCGDSYVDSYVDATGHTEGEWMVTKQPTVDEDGERTLYCSVCGAAIRTESISKLPKGKVHSVEISDIKINYRETAKITPKIEVDDDVTYTVRYESSDPKIATVDENGNVTAMKRGSGSATIKCIVTDQYGNTVEDTCTVNVRLSFAQILITYLLFGWIWY